MNGTTTDTTIETSDHAEQIEELDEYIVRSDYWDRYVEV